MIDFFDSMVILIVARFARKSEIFFEICTTLMSETLLPLMTCTTRTRKFPPSLKWMAAAERWQNVVLLFPRPRISSSSSITVSDGEYKSLTQELNGKEVLIESI